jgi:hypothetical protein
MKFQSFMKNNIALFSFLSMFFVGTQFTISQTVEENRDQVNLSSDSASEVALNTTCDELKNLLNLSEKQEYQVKKVLRITLPKRANIASSRSSSNKDAVAQADIDLKYVRDYEVEILTKVLSEKQMKLYLAKF